MTNLGERPPSDLEALQRWEVSGGTWEVLRRFTWGRFALGEFDDGVELPLCPCTGGEEVDRMLTRDPAVLEDIGDCARSDD